MHLFTELTQAISPHNLLQQFGYLGLFLALFAECGLFFGFFLPGDSLLITAGVLAAAGLLDIKLLAILAFLGAVLGDNLGYWLGRVYGRRLFSRDDSWLFKKKYVAQAEQFYAQYGKKAVIFARFIPIVRTFAPPVAGIANMPYGTYFAYDLVGGLIWGSGVTLVGYYLGSAFPNIDKYIQYVIAVIIIASFVPIIMHVIKDRRTEK